MSIDYAAGGPFTTLDSIAAELIEPAQPDPVAICRPVQALVVHPNETGSLGLSEQRVATNQIRPADELLQAVFALDGRPISAARPPDRRIVGTCRHFAVLSCALLRRQGIAARARCGFATYVHAGKGVDHWITEYRPPESERWIRLDSEILGGTVLDRPEDLSDGQFLTGGEAWLAYRRGGLDASQFGVHGTENWGPAEIRGNAVRDLAALNKVETLPWDEWGRMGAAYAGTTGEDYDELLDTLAETCAGDDADAMAALYEHPDLRVPEALIGTAS